MFPGATSRWLAGAFAEGLACPSAGLFDLALGEAVAQLHAAARILAEDALEIAPAGCQEALA